MAEVRYDVAERVATVTLDRPHARNALSRALRDELWNVVAGAGHDDAVDVVILTGTDPAFCAGIDLREMGGGTPTVPRPGPDGEPGPTIRFFPLIDKPVIGAINGVAVTGGLELALQCDFLVASERARFGDTHARVGAMPGAGATVYLTESIGLRRALEMSLTGNFVDAHEALALGLVNRVVPHDELLAITQRLALDIVSSDQTTVRQLLATYRAVATAPTRDDALVVETAHRATFIGDPDEIARRREGVLERGRQQQG